MKKSLLFFLVFAGVWAFAQQKNRQAESMHGKIKVMSISLKPEKWDFKPGTVEFLEYKSRPVMRLLTSTDPAVLKNLDFSDGTVEYDMEPHDLRFTSFYFKWKDARETECFYFRTDRAGNPQAVDAVQYAPFIDGVNIWDMLFHFQANAEFRSENWNHVKLVVSGKQMRAYVNDMTRPALEVPMLEGNTISGSLAFDGQVTISNLVVRHHAVEGLGPEAGMDPEAHDPRFLRKWWVNTPVATQQNIDFSYDYFPNAQTQWDGISAERRGLVNLTRRFGKTEGRRMVWLKTVIHSDRNQRKNLRMGFSDEVWVIINDKPLYIDKNLYTTPMAKLPDGRCSIENVAFEVPLMEGENQFMVGVANFFYGWGLVARFDDMEGIRFEN
jgi:hypothetical protein